MQNKKPVRVQLSRRKGFKLPPETVVVARPTKWGNPFTVTQKMKPGAAVAGGMGYIAVETVEDAVECFREMFAHEGEPGTRIHAMEAALPELRGKNLACWCALDKPCHADVLLEIANAE